MPDLSVISVITCDSLHGYLWLPLTPGYLPSGPAFVKKVSIFLATGRHSKACFAKQILGDSDNDIATLEVGRWKTQWVI